MTWQYFNLALSLGMLLGLLLLHWTAEPIEDNSMGDEGHNIYPSVPGVAKDSETSADAATSMRSRAASLRQMILDHITASGNGLTCDEVEVNLKLTHQTCSARIRELVLLGDIKQAGEQRVTRQHRKAEVYIATSEEEKSMILAAAQKEAAE